MAKIYGPGRAKGGAPVLVDIDADGLVARSDAAGVGDGDESASATPIRFGWTGIDARMGGYEDAWVIVTSPSAAGDALWLEPDRLEALLQGACPAPEVARERLSAVLVRRQARGRGRFLVRAAGAAVFLAGVVWFFTGGLIDFALGAIPVSAEAKLGELAAESMASDHVPCEDPELTAAVEAILEALVAPMEETPYTFRVRVLRSDEVNAFALPGGELFVYSGLLALADDPSEVAAVMGHEVYHVVGRHGLRGMVRSAGLRGALGLMLGDASESLQLLGAYAGSLSGLKFGRDQEREADTRGITLLSKAGFDTGGGPRFFGRLAELTGDSGGLFDRAVAMTSSHPASTERQERLTELVQSLPPSSGAAVDLDWAALRGRCGGSQDGLEPSSGG